MENVQVLIDNPDSWAWEHKDIISDTIKKAGFKPVFCSNKEQIRKGKFLFMVSCCKVLPKEYLKLNKFDLVIHGSNLPQGKGFSPVVWNVLAGKKEHIVSLILAAEKIDAGDIVMQTRFKLEGHELIGEIRDKLINASCLLISKVLSDGIGSPQKQAGKATYFKRRTPADSEIDLNKPLGEQFDLLRTVDNKRWPAFFCHRGYKYVLEIRKADSKETPMKGPGHGNGFESVACKNKKGNGQKLKV